MLSQTHSKREHAVPGSGPPINTAARFICVFIRKAVFTERIPVGQPLAAHLYDSLIPIQASAYRKETTFAAMFLARPTISPPFPGSFPANRRTPSPRPLPDVPDRLRPLLSEKTVEHRIQRHTPMTAPPFPCRTGQHRIQEQVRPSPRPLLSLMVATAGYGMQQHTLSARRIRPHLLFRTTAGKTTFRAYDGSEGQTKYGRRAELTGKIIKLAS